MPWVRRDVREPLCQIGVNLKTVPIDESLDLGWDLLKDIPEERSCAY